MVSAMTLLCTSALPGLAARFFACGTASVCTCFVLAFGCTTCAGLMLRSAGDESCLSALFTVGLSVAGAFAGAPVVGAGAAFAGTAIASTTMVAEHSANAPDIHRWRRDSRPRRPVRTGGLVSNMDPPSGSRAGFSGAELRAVAVQNLRGMPPPPRWILTAIVTCLKDTSPTFDGRYVDSVSTFRDTVGEDGLRHALVMAGCG